MDFANIKLPIAVIGIIVVQAFAVIWYMAQQDSTVAELQNTVVVLEETIVEMADDLEETVKTQAVITNEMRSIMADHNEIWGKLVLFRRVKDGPMGGISG